MKEKKVAIVTGSSSGIGAEIARELAAMGMNVIVNSFSNRAAGEHLATELGESIHVVADVSNTEGVRKLIKSAIDQYGRLDVLVNNAGRTHAVPHDDMNAAHLDIWKDIFELNVYGTWNITAAAVQEMRKSSGGSVINISSVAGSRPVGSSIPYAVSKAAVDHMTRLLARTLGPRIRVNAVAPGLVETPWTVDNEYFAPIADEVRRLTPLRKIASPSDVAKAVRYLIEAEHVTGEVMMVDGGTSLI
jgi:ketoreductase RED2